MKALIVDALASGKGTRKATRDVIGAGPRTVAGVLEAHGHEARIAPVEQYLSQASYAGYDALLVSGMTSDLQAVRGAKVRAVPTIFINGVKPQRRSLEVFSQAVEEALKKKK